MKNSILSAILLPLLLVPASAALSREEAATAAQELWSQRLTTLRSERAAEMQSKVIELDGLRMPFGIKTYGSKPADGWSLFISMHGGGGAPAPLNDSQWQNQIRLGDAYQPTNAIYVAPRAPTNTWDLWHQEHIDRFFVRLIENLVALEGVNPNKVYIMGYSAGGDGVYQLAPRMADRLAGAAMMAGHPNETSPLGLRNVPFALHVGERDGGYNRNTIAKEWGGKLQALHAEDPEGYPNQVVIHANQGHWMQLQDRAAIPWLQQFTRTPLPNKLVWKQDNVTYHRFYWIGVPKGSAKAGDLIRAEVEGQTLQIVAAEGPDRILLSLNDALVDLDQPLRITGPDGSLLFEGKVTRSIETAQRTFAERADPAYIFFAELLVDLNAKTVTPL